MLALVPVRDPHAVVRGSNIGVLEDSYKNCVALWAFVEKHVQTEIDRLHVQREGEKIP